MSDTNLNIDDLICTNRAAIRELADQYGASNVRIFGSAARGEARPDSDIDIIVTFPADKSVFDLVGLWLDLTELLGRDVSLITDDAIEGEFKVSVERDAVPL